MKLPAHLLFRKDFSEQVNSLGAKIGVDPARPKVRAGNFRLIKPNYREPSSGLKRTLDGEIFHVIDDSGPFPR